MRTYCILAFAILAGCYTEADVGTTSGYYAAGPSVAYVGPGVEVVTDYEYPVFYSDGFYWRWYGSGWYRSPYYDRGWVVAANVPVGVRGIARPWGYAHYHAAPGYRVRGAPGYRGYRAAPTYRGYRAAPQGGVRVRHR